MLLPFLLITATITFTVASQNTVKFTVLHAGDIRGDFKPLYNKIGMKVGGLSRMIAYIEDNKRFRFLLTGNFIRVPYSMSPNRIDIERELLKKLKPVAMSLGTNEFLLEVSNFQKFVDIENMTVLSTNYDIPSTKPEFKAYSAYILGIASESFYNYPLASTSNIFHSETIVEALNQRILYIKEHIQGEPPFFVAMGCVGIDVAKAIAINVTDIKIMFSGCSKTMQWNGVHPPEGIPKDSDYPLEIVNKDGERVIIAHTYGTTKFLGRLDITIENGTMIRHVGTMIYLDNKYRVSEDAEEIIEKLQTFEVAESQVFLNGRCARWECNLGNLITDSFINYKMSTYGGRYYSDTAIALMPAKNIKSNIEMSGFDGIILVDDLLYVINPPKRLVTVEIKGLALRRSIYISMERSTADNGLFLQVSGLHVRYDRRNRPRKRVVTILVRCDQCALPTYSELILTRTYKVVTTIDLFDGSLGHKFFANSSTLLQKENVTDFIALRTYMTQLKTIRVGAMERIRIVKKKSRASSLRTTNCLIIGLMVMICALL